ncbi:MAG TPA: hypothetical protein P5548_03170 [Candidatus Moranbacteria bacterium]|nr:hypothetical protein [Candidatus Moranbacteria bacterium]HRZ33870.1 hypothetical protein [Candidatus Moranbacteria bacterium]
MEKIKLYLIQGLFFSFDCSFSFKNDFSDQMCIVVREGIFPFMFAGMFFPGPKGNLIGGMSDHYGESTLDKVVLSKDKLSFTKKYEHRDDLIDYSFKRKGNLWVGKYSGIKTGDGSSNCMITKAPESLFLPKKK